MNPERDRFGFAFPTLMWLGNLLMTALAVYVSTNFIHHGRYIGGSISSKWLLGFQAWDGSWYISIAQKGYDSLQSTAFFPVYPLLIRGISSVSGLDFGLSGLLLSNLFYLAAINILYLLVKDIWDRQLAVKVLILISVLPSTLYFTMVYTESLTLLLVLLFFLCLRKNYWYPAVFTAVIATGVKQLGLVLALSALIFLFNKRKSLSVKQLTVRTLSLGFIPLSLMMYMLYTYYQFNDAFAFLHAQSYWGREAVIPVVNIVLSLAKLLVKQYEFDFTLMRLVNGLTALFFVYSGFRLLQDRKKFEMDIELKAYYGATLLLSILSAPGGDTEAFGRHMSTLFLGYIVAATIITHRKVFIGVCIGLYVIKLILIGMFSNGYWVT